jgi:hypothetical protein
MELDAMKTPEGQVLITNNEDQIMCSAATTERTRIIMKIAMCSKLN